MKKSNRQTATELSELPDIGKKMARDLRLCHIKCPKDLRGKDAYQLYRGLSRLTGKKHDPCVIDVFLSVVDFLHGGMLNLGGNILLSGRNI